MALHPWHVRYGVDARAYSFAVLWTILGCLWLGKIVRAGGDAWRYWLLFGLNQLLLVWSLPNGIYYAFAFGVAGLAFCLSRLLPESRAVMLSRLVAVNVVAAMAFLLLFLPNALQIGEWGEVNDHHYLSGYVLKNVASQLAFGMEIAWGPGVEAAGLTSFTAAMAAWPVLAWATLVLGASALLVGFFALGRRSPRRRWLLLAVVLGAGLSLLVTWLRHDHFYHRYVVSYLIVPLVAMVGIGAVELGKTLRLRAQPAWLPVLSALLVLGSFAAFTRAQRVVLNTRSYAPFREVAQFVGKQARVSPINVIGYGLGGRVFLIYYPEGKFADTLEELDDELAKAKARGGPVYVVLGYRELNAADPGTAAGVAKLADGAQFVEAAAFAGIDPMFYFHVLRGREG